MPWDYLVAADSTYAVNWTGTTQIYRTYLHSRAVLDNAQVVVEKNFIGPDLHSVDVDWGKVRAYKDAEIEGKLRNFYMLAKQKNMKAAYDDLLDAIAQGRACDNKFTEKMQAATNTTMKNINTSVDRGEVALTVATTVRDLSAETLVVGATFLSGGAALAVLGGGAALKGGGKWQDTGNWKAGAVEFGLNMAVGVVGFKINANASFTAADKLGMQIVLGKVQGALDVPKAWVEGATVQEGAASGALKMGAAPWTELAKDGLTEALKANPKTKMLAIPAQVVINYAVDKAGGAVASAAKPGPAGGAPPTPAPKQDQAALLDPATLTRQFIRNCSIQPIASGTFFDKL